MNDSNNGNDWAQPQPEPAAAGGQDQALATAPADHPLANNEFDFGAFLDVAKLVFEHAKTGPILIAYVGITLIWLFWDLFVGLLMTGTYFAGADGIGAVIAIGAMVLGIIFYPLQWLITGLQLTLYRPLTTKLFGGQIQATSPIELLKQSIGLLVPALIVFFVYTVATLIGTLMCFVPGLIAMFVFYQAPYLAIVHDMPAIEAMQTSLDRTKRHWHVVLMAVIGMIAVVLAVGMVAGIVGLGLSLASTAFAPVGYLGQPLVTWVAGAIFLVANLVLTTTACASIDELEGLKTIAR